MIVRYETVDGKVFSTEAEALEHEQGISFLMYDQNVKETNDTENAVFVVLLNDCSATSFIEKCEANGDLIYTGIDYGDVGVFYYDYYEERYKMYDNYDYENLQKAKNLYDKISHIEN